MIRRAIYILRAIWAARHVQDFLWGGAPGRAMIEWLDDGYGDDRAGRV